jgi:hypothetical protein
MEYLYQVSYILLQSVSELFLPVVCISRGRRLWGLDGVGAEKGEVADICEYGNELSVSIKCGEFLD